MSMLSTNTGNLWWKHIKSTDRVEPSKPSGKAWIVIRDGERYLVNWSSHDAAEAQAFLITQIIKEVQA